MADVIDPPGWLSTDSSLHAELADLRADAPYGQMVLCAPSRRSARARQPGARHTWSRSVTCHGSGEWLPLARR
jgi:hypothetical protein